MSGTFPPAGLTSLAKILPAYVFKQYSDDDNIQAFNSAFNAIAQQYQDWFNQINLPIYTGLAGALLDWVAQGVYGIIRPALSSGQITGVGLLNTYEVDTLTLNTFVSSGSIQNFSVNDDIFKRIITWFFFKGDGMNYSILWLKRRIMRFLIGTSGAAPNIDNTYPVSVAYGSGDDVDIIITLTDSPEIDPAVAQIFRAAVASGKVALPFQFSFSVTVVP